jgi:ABC-type sugar transport system ATPase subunit
MSLLDLPVENGAVELDGLRVALPAAAAASVGDRVLLGIRAEDVRPSAATGIAARVKTVEHLGANANATCVLGPHDGRELTIVASIDSAHAPSLDERLTLEADVERIHWFSAETGERLPDGR